MPENFIKLFLIQIAAVIIISKVSGHICGGGRFGNCFQKCIRECITRSNGVFDPDALDDIITDKLICEGKCRGEVMNLDPKFTTNQDFKNCSRPCVAPTSEYCFKGFLTWFLYCDYHACCAALPTIERRVHCAIGCIEWFLKPDGPGGIHVCRFKSEYQQTPNNWCTSYCTWQLIKLENYEVKQYPEIISRWAKPCIAGCIAHLQNGIKIDYFTIVNSSCTGTADQWKCLDIIKITKFVVPIGITQQQFSAATPSQPISLGSKLGGLNKDDPTPENHSTHNQADYQRFQLKMGWPSFKNYPKTTVDPNAANRVQLPASKAPQFPWSDLGELLVESLEHSYSVGKWNLITFNYIIYLDGCTHYDSDIFGRKQEFKFQIELYAEISNPNTILPLTAPELRRALGQSSQFDEFQYVRDIDDFTIEVKAVANATAILILEEPKLEIYNCTKVPNCPNPNWDAAKTCKLNFQNSSIQALTVTYSQ